MSLLGHSLLVLPGGEVSSQTFACESYSITTRKLMNTDDSKNGQFQASEMELDSQCPNDHYV